MIRRPLAALVVTGAAALLLGTTACAGPDATVATGRSTATQPLVAVPAAAPPTTTSSAPTTSAAPTTTASRTTTAAPTTTRSAAPVVRAPAAAPAPAPASKPKPEPAPATKPKPAPAAAPAPKPAPQPAAAPEPAPGPAPEAAAGGCNRNYDPCVPDDPKDVDCAGGSGNGPSYVKGPVRVTGDDVYGLDADHDGVGCE